MCSFSCEYQRLRLRHVFLMTAAVNLMPHAAVCQIGLNAHKTSDGRRDSLVWGLNFTTVPQDHIRFDQNVSVFKKYIYILILKHN